MLQGKWIAEGAHINAVGAPRPDWRELDDDVLDRASIYVDSTEACLVESGDILAAPEVVGELGHVVLGDLPGRQTEHEITLFKSIGMAIEDVASADLIYQSILARATTQSAVPCIFTTAFVQIVAGG